MLAKGPSIRPQPQDVYNHFARLSADQQLAVVLAFPGHLELSRLESAVAALLREQPVLGCRFSYHDGRAKFAAVEASTRLSVCQTEDALRAAMDAASQPLDFSGDGVLRVDLVRDAETDALVVRIDHVAADGQGAKQIIAALAACYRVRAKGGDLERSVKVPDRSAARLLRRFGLREKLGLLTSGQNARPAWGLPVAGDATGARRHQVVSLDQDQFGPLQACGRRLGATVNDLVLAAFYRALFAELSPAEGKSMAINVSFDLRRYLDPSDPMPAAANLSGTQTALLARVAGEGYTETLSRTVCEMGRLKEGHPGLGAAVLLEYASRLGYRRVEKLAAEPMRRGREHGVSFPFLSNFGVLDEAALTFGELTPSEAVVLPPVGHPPFMMLSPSSYAGRLSLVIGYQEGETDPALVQRILDAMLTELTEWSARMGLGGGPRVR